MRKYQGIASHASRLVDSACGCSIECGKNAGDLHQIDKR